MPRDEQPQEAHAERMRSLKDKTHKKIDYQLQKNYIAVEEFYHLIAGFFLELLEKEYEPTYEELVEEIEELEHEFIRISPSQRERIKQLLTYLSALEYRGHQITIEQARQFLNMFKQLATELTSATKETIDDVLQKGLKHLRDSDLEKAHEHYKKARDMYEMLEMEEKQNYYEALQEFFHKLETS